MKAAVVIPTHGRPAGLAACLASIEIPPDLDTEIIVVENGSAEAEDTVREHGGTYLHRDEGNASAARNAGIDHAASTGARVVALLDDDVTAHPGWLGRLVQPILDSSASATVGAVRVVTRARVDRRLFGLYVDSEYALDPERPFLAGLNMAVDPVVFSAMGGFRTDLGPGGPVGGVGGEDILLGLMLVDAGHRIEAVMEAVVDHHIPADRFTDQAVFKRAVGGGRANGWITYHWHHRQYRWPYVRAARWWGASRLPGLDLMRRLGYAERYGQAHQLRLEAGRPFAVERSAPPRRTSGAIQS